MPSASGTDLRVGLIGAGFLAETRARCWARVRGASLVAVAARTPESAEAFRARHALERAFDDAEALMRSGEVDVVDLCVPNALHRSLAEAAAGAGLHVICTKPLTAYTGQDLPAGASASDVQQRDRAQMRRAAEADARALVAAAAQAGVKLCYGENWIYAPPIVRVRELLARGGAPLVELRGWEAHSGSHSPYARSWQHTGGGALLRQGAHPIGAMLLLKREEGVRLHGRATRVVAVSAEVADLSAVRGVEREASAIATDWGEVENWGSVVIHFDDGSRGVAHGSDNLLGGMQSRLELSTPNAHYQCTLSPNDALRSYAAHDSVLGDANLIEKQSTTAGWNAAMCDEDESSGQLAMCQAFADALARGEAPASDGQLGLDVVSVVYAAYQSAAEGRRISLESL